MATAAPRALCTVLDPRGQPTVTSESQPLAARLETLRDKTIYVLDVGFGGGWEFLEETVAWFSRNVPSAKLIMKHKKTIMFLDEPETWQEIKQNGGDAVIFGVGG